MIRKNTLFVASTLAPLFALSAFAETTTLSPTLQAESRPAAQRMLLGEEQVDVGLFLGVESGYSGMGSAPAGQFNKDGYDLGLKGLVSLYTGRIVTDIGGGWNYNYISGTDGSQTRDTRTRSGFAELSPRLRVGDNWQIGPDVQIMFGTDHSFPEGARSADNTAWMLGAQALYEFNAENRVPLRLGAKFLTDLDIADRQIYLGMVAFQIGFIPTAPASDVITTSSAAPIVAPAVNVVLDDRLVHFKTDSARLMPKSREFLKEVGRVLGETGGYNNLQIGGHTDDRGTFEYNLRLSLNRADSVKQALIEGGADAKKLETLGYSMSRPLESAKTNEARSRNRRVELKFNGADKADLIKAGIEEAKVKTGFADQILMD